MPLSQSNSLRYIAGGFGTICIGFGINALVNPISALSFFELAVSHTISANDQKVFDVLMVVYAIRDIFWGFSMYIPAYYGDRKSLGWIMIFGSAMAFADGFVCKYMVGKGEWGHWGYAPMMTALGVALLGLFD